MDARRNRGGPGLAVLAVALGGCSLSLLGGSTTPGGGGDGAGKGGGGAEGQAVRDAYAAFDFSQCDRGDCSVGVREAAGIQSRRGPNGTEIFNPRASMDNPDPEWIPGWDSLPTQSDPTSALNSYRALTLAAINKSWQQRCFADYEAWDAELRERDARIDTTVESLRGQEDPYARLAGLLALRPEVKGSVREIQALGVFVGAPYRLEHEIAAAFEAAGRSTLYHQRYRPSADFVRWGRERLPMEEERARYCALAVRGTDRTPPLPDLSSYVSRVEDDVRPAVEPGLAERLQQERKTTEKRNREAFGGKVPSLGELAEVPAEGRVTTITAKGETVVVEIDHEEQWTEGANCKHQREHPGAASSGLDCKSTVTVTAEIHTTTTFAELPTTCPVAKGDAIAYLGRQTGKEASSSPRGKKARQEKASLRYEGHHITQVVHDGRRCDPLAPTRAAG
ncbi:MAG: hypothetical protein KC501_14645 [Myxococcales bacterium]|nr:hypothetical protein [Myxococcales bacterium]